MTTTGFPVTLSMYVGNYYYKYGSSCTGCVTQFYTGIIDGSTAYQCTNYISDGTYYHSQSVTVYSEGCYPVYHTYSWDHYCWTITSE